MLNTLSMPFLLLQEAAGSAPAEGAGGAADGGILQGIGGSMLFPLVLCFGVFWLLILRPESKQRKKRLEMLAAIQKGDKVQTNGGMFGTVVQVQEGVVTLQVDEGVRLRFAQSAIASVIDADGAAVTESSKK